MTAAGAICGGDYVREKTRHISLKWCFGCRGRFLHTWVVLTDSDALSYWGPIVRWECENCGKDETGFPGTEWWYGEA